MSRVCFPEIEAAGEARVLAGPDLYARALIERGAGGPLMVERERGGVFPTSLAWWLRRPDVPEPWEVRHLSLVSAGPVLDVGCATGRHLEWLGAAGVGAEGVDVNPHAVALARHAGCTATCADIWSFTPSQAYRWVLLLGNNVGIAGRLPRLPDLLRRLASLLAPGGRILLSTEEPAWSSRPEAGEVRLRLHYDGRIGAWFDWLYVDRATLSQCAAAAGLVMTVQHRTGDTYLATLSRTGDAG